MGILYTGNRAGYLRRALRDIMRRSWAFTLAMRGARKNEDWGAMEVAIREEIHVLETALNHVQELAQIKQ